MSHPLPPPWTQKNVWQGANIKHKCFSGKREKTATPMDCAVLLPAHEVIHFSLETVWLNITEPSMELAPNQSIVYRHPTYLHRVYDIVLKIPEHSRLKGNKSTSQRISSLPGERPSAWSGDAEGYITCTLLYNHPSSKYTSFLFLQEKCIIEVRLKVVYITAKQHNQLCSPLYKKDICIKGEKGT